MCRHYGRLFTQHCRRGHCDLGQGGSRTKPTNLNDDLVHQTCDKFRLATLPLGLDRSLGELIKDDPEHSKTQHEKDACVENGSCETQTESSEASSKGVAISVLAGGSF